MKPKTYFGTLILALTITGAASAGTDFDKGFNDGWAVGWNGDFTSGQAPMAPIPPLPPIGGDDYQHGVAAGSAAGQRAHAAQGGNSVHSQIGNNPMGSPITTQGSSMSVFPQYNPLPPQDFVNNSGQATINGLNQGMNLGARLAGLIGQITGHNSQNEPPKEAEQASHDAVSTPNLPIPDKSTLPPEIQSLTLEQVPDLVKSAENGNAYDELRLGLVFMEGDFTEKNPASAILWLSKSATQGNGRAEVLMGISYLMGSGVTKDTTVAKNYFAAALGNGDIDAALYIGLMFGDGEGLDKNPSESYAWFNYGSINGQQSCRTLRDEMELSLSNDQIISGLSRTAEIIKQIDDFKAQQKIAAKSQQ